MKNQLAIVGAGGHARVVADAALCSGEWEGIDFFAESGTGAPLAGTPTDLLDCADDYRGVIVAVGANRARQMIFSELRGIAAPLVSVIHPSAILSPSVELGVGSVVLAGAVLNPGAMIGNNCILNTRAVVEHDCILSDSCHISPNAALGGGVHIGELSWIGLGANVRHGARIGENVTVGIGAAVVTDLFEAGVYAGVPAKRI